MKGLGLNIEEPTTYKSQTDFGMLLTCNNNDQTQQEPKLENFLGDTNTIYNNISTSSDQNNTIGLSMIKTWLRNQPKDVDVNAISGSGQNLSLSMSTSADNNNNTNKNKNKNSHKNKTKTTTTDNPSAAAADQTEAAQPKKSIENFGQRTSVYRGVTRLILYSSTFNFFFLIIN